KNINKIIYYQNSREIRHKLNNWFKQKKNIMQIKRQGHLKYASKRLKYAVLYVDQDDIDEITFKLEKFSFITRVEQSLKPFVETEFENKQPDEAKVYDYNMGI